MAEIRSEVLATVRSLAFSQVQETVAKKFAELAPEAELALHLREDLELDSVRLLSLAVEVEDRFEICLDPEDEDQIETVRDLVQVVDRKLSTRETP